MGTFKPDFRGIGEMLRSSEMEAEMARRAEKVKAKAAATAPVDTGRYKASLEVSSTTKGGNKKDRASATVTADVEYAFTLEYGSTHNARYRTLGKALDAARD